MLRPQLPRIIRPKQEIAPLPGVLQQLLLLPALPSNSSNSHNLVLLPEQKTAVISLDKPQNPPQRPYFSSVKGYTADHQGVGSICRTCYRVVYNNNFVRLYEEDNDENSEKLRSMLKQIVRTIDFDIYAEPIMCTKCMSKLFECHEFLTKCWDTEVKFNHWVSQRKRIRQEEVNLLILVEGSTNGDEFEEQQAKVEVTTIPPKQEEVELVDLTVNGELQEDLVKTEHCDLSLNDSFLTEHSYAGLEQRAPKTKKKFNYKVKLSKAEKMRLIRAKQDRKKGPFLCELCGYMAKSRISFSLHLSVHENLDGGPFKCEKCSYTSKCLDTLKRHAVRHLEPSHKCTECGKSYKFEKSLRLHIKNIHSDNPDCRQCHICGKSFKYSRSFQLHLQTHNPEKIVRCVCEFCGKRSSTLGLHRRHLLSHSSKMYTCELCGRQLKRKQNLRKHHEIYHDKDEKHNCDVCKRSFWKTENLAKHKIKNHGVGNEKRCHICHMDFSRRDKFLNHLAEDHGQLIECEVCGVKVKSQWSLKNHFNIHHGNGGRFKCEICNKGFWKQNVLLNHARKVHGFDGEEEEEPAERVDTQGGENSEINVEDFNLDKENVLVEPVEVLGFF